MLIPKVDITSSESLNENLSNSLLTFISHIGILGVVLLKVKDLSSEKETSSLSIVQSAISMTACYIDGLDIDDDVLATNLLNNGARVVFFNYNKENEIDESQKRVLSLLPRDRVGLSCAELTDLTISSVQKIVEQSREYTSNFLFRLPADSNFASIAAIKEKAKEIEKGLSVLISFLLVNNETEKEVSVIGSTTECFNSVFYPKIQTTLPDDSVLTSPSPVSDQSIVTVDYVTAYIACLSSDRLDGLEI